jgi:TPR repeat protein
LQTARGETPMRRAVLGSTMCFFLLFSGLAARADEIKDALLALTKDHSNPKATFSKIAESGNPKILAALGVMFFDGIGVPINHREAMPFLQKAADLNRPEAQYRLGLAYSKWNGSLPRSQNYYDDPPADATLAERWFNKAANSAQDASLSGDPAAITTLGHLHEMGLGGVSKDLIAAKRLYSDAAKQGYPDAAVSLGALALIDLKYPIKPENLQECLSWYGKAANEGSSEGIEGLGLSYVQAGDREKALPLLRQAASLGREPASRFLYLRFNEKVGNNIALDMDKSFEAKRKIRNLHDLTEKLSDPVVMAGIIVALSGVLAVALYDPDMPEAERTRREHEWANYEAERKQEEADRNLQHSLDDWGCAMGSDVLCH